MIHARNLTPAVRTQLRELLALDGRDAKQDIVAIEWGNGRKESRRVSPLTKAEILALVAPER